MRIQLNKPVLVVTFLSFHASHASMANLEGPQLWSPYGQGAPDHMLEIHSLLRLHKEDSLIMVLELCHCPPAVMLFFGSLYL